MAEFVLHVRKFQRNTLLNRKQMAIEIIHPEAPNVSRSDLRDKISGIYKTAKDNVVVYGLKTKFGGGRSSGFALVYDSIADRKKYDAHHNLVRDGLSDPPTRNRRPKKELKLRLKKVRGTAKADLR